MGGTPKTRSEIPLEEEDNLDPLFSYAKIQPRLILDYEEEEEEPPLPLKWQARMKKARMEAPRPVVVERVETPAPVVLEEDDWLAPPQKVVQTGTCTNFSTAPHMRQKILELMQIANRPDPSPTPVPAASLPSTSTPRPTGVKPSQPEKVRIFIQDKNGERKQYAISKSEKLQRLFNAYANCSGVKSSELVFKFDGEALEPGSTLQDHDMEDEDQIEVYRKT